MSMRSEYFLYTTAKKNLSELRNCLVSLNDKMADLSEYYLDDLQGAT